MKLAKQKKKYFQTGAEQCRAKYTAAYATSMKAEDNHSLAKERMNGIMINIDRWYELYNVQFGNTLYLKPDKRA